jgi:hypothetical protein
MAMTPDQPAARRLYTPTADEIRRAVAGEPTALAIVRSALREHGAAWKAAPIVAAIVAEKKRQAAERKRARRRAKPPTPPPAPAPKKRGRPRKGA